MTETAYLRKGSAGPTAFFVYGTLRKGEDTEFAYRLCSETTYVGAARVRGRLFLIEHYPGLIRSEAGWVQGDLFTGVSLELLRLLDAYEGAEYTRETIEVTTKDEQVIEAWIYIYAKPTECLGRIVSGDWLDRELLVFGDR